MIGVIITGHGNIASGLESGVKLVFGSAPSFGALDFTEDIAPEVLEQKLNEKIDELNNEKGVLILSDIAGGTPFKTASLVSLKKEKVKVISGVNFPMLLEVLSERDSFDDISELYKHAMKTGKDEIVSFELKEKKEVVEEEDGI